MTAHKKHSGRRKGSGQVKAIDAEKHDFFEVIRILDEGCEPIRDDHALLLRDYRSAITARDWLLTLGAQSIRLTQGQLKELSQQILDNGRELLAALGAMSEKELSDKLATLSKAVAPSGHGWKIAATRILYWQVWFQCVDKDILSPAQFSPKFVPARILPAGKTVSLTTEQLLSRLEDQGYTARDHGLTAHALRRFVTHTLQIKLPRSQRGWFKR